MSDTMKEDLDMTDFKKDIENLRLDARAHSFHSMLLTHRIANAALLACNLSVPKEAFLVACGMAYDETAKVLDDAAQNYFEEHRLPIIKKHTLAHMEREALLTPKDESGKVGP